jgi:ABC-type polar amino acid transport system ATPase subunit
MAGKFSTTHSSSFARKVADQILHVKALRDHDNHVIFLVTGAMSVMFTGP